MRTFTTICSADNFQYYIPLYVMALREWSEDDIIIFVRGELRQRVRNSLAIGGFKGIEIVENYALNYPDLPGMTNSLRFVRGSEKLKDSLFTLITDIDLLILNDPWEWFLSRNSTDSFVGYHGAWTKPFRPEICQGWSGNFERVAGGLVCVRKDWWEKTLSARKKYNDLLFEGKEGKYRECDEVILARIIKESGMEVPESKELPANLRGLHLGDFKFTHRVENKDKMKRLLTNESVEKYKKLRGKNKWKQIIEELNSEWLNGILKTVDTYVEGR